MAEVAVFGSWSDAFVWGVVLSGDNARLAVASAAGTATIYDVRSGAKEHEFVHPGAVYSVDYSGEGQVLSTVSQDGWVRVIDCRDGRSHLEIRPRDGAASVCAFSPVDTYALVGCVRRGAYLYDLRRVGAEPLRAFCNHEDGVDSVCFSSDGKLAVCVSACGVTRVWDVDASPVLREIDDGALAVSPRPDSDLLVRGSRDGQVRVFDARETGVKWAQHVAGGRVRSVSCAGRNSFVAAAAGSFFYLWDWERRAFLRRFNPQAGQVNSVNLSADGTLVAAGGRTGQAHLYLLWDAI